jgi:hypothetical protein
MVWLRRSADRAQAGVVPVPPKLEAEVRAFRPPGSNADDNVA